MKVLARWTDLGTKSNTLTNASSASSISTPTSGSPIFLRCHCLMFLYVFVFYQNPGLAVNDSNCIMVFFVFSPESHMLCFVVLKAHIIALASGHVRQ